MAKERRQHGMAVVLRILVELMKSGPLSVGDLIKRGLAPTDSSARRRLRVLERELPYIRRSPKRPRKWSFDWPQERRSTPAAVLALQLAYSLLDVLGEGALDVELESLVRDHAARLPAEARATMPTDLSRMFFAKTRILDPAGVEPDIIDRIATAMFRGRCVEARYSYFDGRRDEVVLEPYSIVFHDEGLYCVGKCVQTRLNRSRGEVRPYNIARVARLKVSDRGFVYPRPRRYDPEERFKNCFGIFMPPEGSEPKRVVLRFDRRWRAYLKRHRWFASQKPPTKSEGRCKVTFKLHLTEDLVRWILGFGKDVEVIAPIELRERVREQRGA